jgi:hypothetical protein
MKAYGAVCTPDIFVYNKELSPWFIAVESTIQDQAKGNASATRFSKKGTL